MSLRKRSETFRKSLGFWYLPWKIRVHLSQIHGSYLNCSCGNQQNALQQHSRHQSDSENSNIARCATAEWTDLNNQFSAVPVLDLFSGAYARGVHVHPGPGKKVPLRNVQKRNERSAKKNVHVPLRYDKIKTKKVGKKEKKSKRKEVKFKEVKKEDSRLSEIKIIK